jgi:hypothetical protein
MENSMKKFIIFLVFASLPAFGFRLGAHAGVNVGDAKIDNALPTTSK